MSDALDHDDLLDDDEEWGERPGRRARPRAVLLALLALSLAFFAGARVHEQFGADPTSSAAAAFPGGFDPGSLPEGIPGGGAAPGGEDTSAESLLIGTVVSVKGTTWTVEDLGGAKHTVVVDDDASVARSHDVDRHTVRSGDDVTISGTTAGSAAELTATSVTLR